VISTYEDRHKAEARAKLDATAKEMGYSLTDLVGTDAKPTRAPDTAKYRHPENPRLTWSGHGRKALWFVAVASRRGVMVSTLRPNCATV